jgi:septal ring factor EnvC (AmiA/AmiB activator)
MWPKALAQLIELAPHITRLVPMADRFLNAKSSDAEASRTAMQQMAEGLRGDLGQVTASHAGLYRQLNDQSEKLSVLSAELRFINFSIEALETRLQAIERAQRQQHNLVLVTLAAVVIGVMVLIVLRH